MGMSPAQGVTPEPNSAVAQWFLRCFGGLKITERPRIRRCHVLKCLEITAHRVKFVRITNLQSSDSCIHSLGESLMLLFNEETRAKKLRWAMSPAQGVVARR